MANAPAKKTAESAQHTRSRGSGVKAFSRGSSNPYQSKVLELQRVAGNRAVTELLRRPARVGHDAGLSVQRLVDLHYALIGLRGSPTPDAVPASVADIRNWLRNADTVLHTGGSYEAELADPIVTIGAQFLTSPLSTKRSFTFARRAEAPNKLVADLKDLGRLFDIPARFHQFLTQVWGVRQMPGDQLAGAIYDLYGGQTPGQPAPTTPQDRTHLLRIQQFFQTNMSAWHTELQGSYFLHVDSPGYFADQKLKRFYFNPGPDYPAAVKTFVNLCPLVAKYQGKAKIVSPSQHGNRNDAIVVWIPQTAGAQAEAELQGTDLSSLGAVQSGELPFMLRQVSPGIATGEEPSGDRVESFGSLRAVLLAEAVQGANNFEEFAQNAQMAFSIAGIPWQHPDQGGQVKGLVRKFTLDRHI